MNKKIVLSLKNISKTFPGVKALDGVNLDFYEGEVHSICGENGAGKSTLMKILSGVYSLEEGEILLNGEKVSIKNPLDALNKGQSIIFQEFNLIDPLSISENIFLGRMKNNGSFIDWKSLNEEARKLVRRVGYDLDPNKLVKDLSVAEKQMVEIAKALSYNSKIIIMDEPSSSLTTNEVNKLLDIVRELKKNNVTVIYISHKLDEVMSISDRVSVMRDGQIISTYDISNITTDKIIEEMVGRPVSQEYPKRNEFDYNKKDIILEVKDLNRKGIFSNISFKLYRGEVLGFAGLVGAGRTEIVRAIFGADKIDSGEIFINCKKVSISSPKIANELGIALLTEDRKKQGLHLDMSVSNNVSCANLKGILSKHLIDSKKENIIANEYIKTLGIKTPSANQKAVNLSGGNQQKVVIAKWLYADSDIIILDEPTRGIDVGAKMEIYNLINDLVSQGKSIIMISSELPELLAMSDRVLTIYEGKIKGELIGEDITSEKVMETMLKEGK